MFDQRSFTQQKSKARARSYGKKRAARRSSYNPQHGRYARAVIKGEGGSRIALDATLRAAAQHAGRGAQGIVSYAQGIVSDAQGLLPVENGSPIPVSGKPALFRIDTSALRYKRFKRKTGTLFIFAIDASGSMALNRIGQAKGALVWLLRQSYVRRDRVALVSFRGRRAEALLPPCRSTARAKHILDALPVGGATPLPSGLAVAIEIAERAAQQGTQDIILLLFTDGRANVSLSMDETLDRATRSRVIEGELYSLGVALRRAGVQTVVVDTQNRFVTDGAARSLAQMLGGRHVSLSSGTRLGHAAEYSKLALQRT